MSKTTSIIIRYAFVLLFLWFGVMQLASPGVWTAFLPTWTGYLPIPGVMLVQLNGWFEIVFAFVLLIGFYTRFVFVILGLHLLGIAATVGGAIGVRDATLGLVSFAMGFSSSGALTLDNYFKNKKDKQIVELV